jgi:hypothetical protein
MLSATAARTVGGCGRAMTAIEYEKLCQRQCDEIDELWETYSDILPPQEMIALSWAAVQRHRAEKRKVWN